MSEHRCSACNAPATIVDFDNADIRARNGKCSCARRHSARDPLAYLGAPSDPECLEDHVLVSRDEDVAPRSEMNCRRKK